MRIEVVGQTVTLKSGETSEYRESQPRSAYQKQKPLEPVTGRSSLSGNIE